MEPGEGAQGSESECGKPMEPDLSVPSPGPSYDQCVDAVELVTRYIDKQVDDNYILARKARKQELVLKQFMSLLDTDAAKAALGQLPGLAYDMAEMVKRAKEQC